MIGHRWYMALSEYSFNMELISGVTSEVADSMSRLCRNNMKDAPREFSEKVIFWANIIEEFTLTKAQYRTISSVHNSNVGHFGLDRTLTLLKAIEQVWEFQRQHVRHFINHCPCFQKMSLLKIPTHGHGFTTSTYTPMECLKENSSDRAWNKQNKQSLNQTHMCSSIIALVLHQRVFIFL
jgi:hypothetical protein